ncbi:twitching motility protein PilH [Methylophaga frappieri]|uniref:Twitching motility protein PilH n=1 Tax=Methylophaga frappieri (strain ATCC BAA-2434 / DSM 25690 / JAM7) TaxID=754477 RepID=I1YJ13_METFJ|nr:twitching motility response regulator PilH [Methylophaga frappieri]AFJ02906.1 twitching motility protein PilH [Methylophaga frappieri]
MALILIADDSPTEVYVLRQMLEKHGHEVIVADNGEQAIEVALSAQPDLILMDVVMPELNGFQATRRLTRDPETTHIPIIIVSSKNQETDKLWGLRQGARGYLGKPVAESELLSQINDLTDG